MLRTIDVYDEGQQANFKFFLIKKALWLASFLSLGSIKAEDRGDTILALGKKTSAITDRYPAFLYVWAEVLKITSSYLAKIQKNGY